ncbi:MAG: aminomethyl-transferring glycine dehydrogenase subunit GcvPA [Clostridia bacterium]|nr:aminomethyl-transferring glycine dehydrogenase subunit GcvPA [Clostridia bacterium]
MHHYIPNTDDDKKLMLDELGIDDIQCLFKDVPEDIKLNRSLNLKGSLSEMELEDRMKDIASLNKSTEDLVCFMGAGAYDHYIPSVVKHVLSRSEFYTAYTPYQAEVSQGTLQTIFEYQTMICELTGMDVANASMYDGASACAEAAVMAAAVTRKDKVVVAKTIHPETRKVLDTYTKFKGMDIVEIDQKDGATDLEKLEAAMDDNTAAVIVQSPNFLGIIEELELIEKLTHSKKALLIVSVDPISLGILKSPGEIGADIAVGEGQCLGNQLNFGGPYLGFMAVTSKLMRKMPGRIAGQTVDAQGDRGFILTLQAREQHIRREKATSNICTNQALNALAAAVYMTALGKKGIREVATQCLAKAHYAYDIITKTDGFSGVFDKPFFKEFVIDCPVDCSKVNDTLLKNGILGGFELVNHYPAYSRAMLFCVTEKRTKQQMDDLAHVLEGIR